MTLQFCRNNKIEDIKQFGSSLKLCKIAEGEIDVYPRYIESKEWDIAAAHCILNEAGCEIIDLVSKKPVIYNKENIPNNSFIAASKAMISTYIY